MVSRTPLRGEHGANAARRADIRMWRTRGETGNSQKERGREREREERETWGDKRREDELKIKIPFET